MGLFSSDIKTMDDLFLHTLRDIYYAEKQILKNLPKMAEKATNEALRSGFEKHEQETRVQIERLESVFSQLGEDAKAVKCPAIDGILKEADEIVGEVDDDNVLDAALIAAAQAVEHYEITRYGTLVAWAGELGHDAVVRELTRTLDEEKRTDESLTKLGKERVNARAA